MHLLWLNPFSRVLWKSRKRELLGDYDKNLVPKTAVAARSPSMREFSCLPKPAKRKAVHLLHGPKEIFSTTSAFYQ
jgi:hypothetical protein